MSELPQEDECDTCGHERWHHGQDESQCTFGWEGDCECQAFRDEAREAALAYWTPLLNS